MTPDCIVLFSKVFAVFLLSHFLAVRFHWLLGPSIPLFKSWFLYKQLSWTAFLRAIYFEIRITRAFWKIPWTEEPGRLQSMELLRVRHNWATSLSLFIFMHWRRKWQPTPVFLPGESQGRGSLVGCCLRGHTESDTTEAT